jgi:hypothetical protein
MSYSKKTSPIPIMVTRGVLVSAVEADSSAWDREALKTAFNSNGLESFMTEGEWGLGGIGFNVFTPVKGGSTRNDGIGKYAAAHRFRKFANALNRIMQVKEVKELQISGHFEVSIDPGGGAPVVFYVQINGGGVSYQQAEIVWSDSVILPSSNKRKRNKTNLPTLRLVEDN